MDTFLCAECHEVFKKGWSDEEALQAFQNEYTVLPSEVPGSSSLICEYCYEKIMNRMRGR